MKAIKTFAITLLASLSLSSPLIAGSADFAGIWGGVTASVNGAAIDGTHTDRGGDVAANKLTTKGKVGAVVPTAGLEAGFNLPLGDVFFITVGGTYIKGKVNIATSENAAGDANITVAGENSETIFIAPSVSFFDNSAMYIKYGSTDIGLVTKGAVDAEANFDLKGTLYGVGMITQFNSGIYVKTEASAAQFDNFSITGVAGSSTAVVEGDPLIASGTVSIGYKF